MATKQRPSAGLHPGGMSVEDAQEIVAKNFDWLTRSENIHSLAVDWKTVKGNKTERPALVFYVSKKKPIKDLEREGEIDIPKKVPGKDRDSLIETDVVQMESFKLEAHEAAGGSEIAICDVRSNGNTYESFGTLGANITYTESEDKLRLLTSAHIVYYDRDRVGSMLYQKTPTGMSDLFPITGIFPVKMYDARTSKPGRKSQLDVMWANVTDKSKILRAITAPNVVPSGISEGIVDDDCTVSGAKTGFHDNVSINNASVSTIMTGKDANGETYYTYWEKLMRYNIETQSGDSGAVLLRKSDKKIIGLHTAGNGGMGYATQLYPVTLAEEWKQ